MYSSIDQKILDITQMPIVMLKIMNSVAIKTTW